VTECFVDYLHEVKEDFEWNYWIDPWDSYYWPPRMAENAMWITEGSQWDMSHFDTSMSGCTSFDADLKWVSRAWNSFLVI